MKWTSERFWSQIKKVLWITFAWITVSIYQFLIGYGAMVDMQLAFDSNEVVVQLKTNLLVGVIAGLSGGTIIVFVWERWLRSKPYNLALTGIFISYTVIYVFVSILVSFFFLKNTQGLTILDTEGWNLTLARLFSGVSLVSFTFWLAVVIFTIIVLLVNDKYGPGVFKKFLLGKYFNPQREERVFMFLDLRSSTSIAERLGEEKYFNFLKDVFKHATNGILKYRGEIYQYVGDEIVISWNMNLALKNASCINCYFEIQSIMKSKKDYFIETYGEAPEFKAGLHYGYVMAGEIGIVKREIAFSGDVLNTTARIQDKCNELGVNILLSKLLVDKLNLSKKKFSLKEMGAMKLRGKRQPMTLFTV